MKSVQFIFGVHTHQPVGNFDFVFEEAYRKSYGPFLDILEKYPSVSLVLHLSGCLIEWFEDHYPEYLDRIAKLVKRGSVEILSGGFYEPLLSAIPDHDKLGQIGKMNDYVKNRFGYDVEGLWLTERVWEPHLAKPIVEAGINYTVVDDFHFLASGKKSEQLTGYFITEEQGYPLGIFPIQQKLRYAMPFGEPEESIEFLKRFATVSGENAIIMADDGEKFGLWPGTYERCYGKENWMEEFFRLLEKNSPWLRTTTFKEYFKSQLARGRIYLPTTSYFEMNEWTLPAEQGERFSRLVSQFESKADFQDIRPFLRGGTWRNFLSMYDESNWLHKRMLATSYRLAEAGSSRLEKLATAQDDLWRSQCNCAYWHGIFGGLYLPHLRHSVYENLISAEKELDRNIGFDSQPRDIDGDGAREYEVSSSKLKIIVSERGGMIQEFDYLPKNFNLVNTLRRYPESYHSTVRNAAIDTNMKGNIHRVTMAKESGLAALLHYDQWPRKMLLDHFIPSESDVESLKKGVSEKGDFLDSIFESSYGRPLRLWRSGRAFGRSIRLVKELLLSDSELEVRVSITNEDKKSLAGIYSCELNFSMLGGHVSDRYYEVNAKKARPKFLDSTAQKSRVRSLGLASEPDGFRVEVIFTRPVNLWHFPVETVSRSEAGFERIYQSSVVMPFWSLHLKPGDGFESQFAIRVEELGGSRASR